MEILHGFQKQRPKFTKKMSVFTTQKYMKAIQTKKQGNKKNKHTKTNKQTNKQINYQNKKLSN